jgi:hypothetical protein
VIDVKQAVRLAKASAADMLDHATTNLEEIERDTYKCREVWSITLSLPRDLAPLGPFSQLSPPIQYKRFLIDAETGELVAMKLPEVVSQ